MKLTKVRQELDLIKSEVRGVYRHKNIGVFELVVKVNKENQTMNTIFISQFGAVNESYNKPYIPNNLHLFPENKNMNQMLENPFEWNDFMRKFQNVENF